MGNICAQEEFDKRIKRVLFTKKEIDAAIEKAAKVINDS